MPLLTPELGLQEAVLDDDSADYLVDMLGPSLSIVDGLFAEGTGHNHAGAHQGGKIVAADLIGPFDFHDWIRSTGVTTPLPTTGIGLELYWDSAAGAGTVQSYDRTLSAYRSTTIRGQTVSLINGVGQAVTLDAAGVLNIPGSINAPGGLTVGGNLTAGGDITGKYLHTSDGANGAVYADVGNLFLRPAGGSQVILDGVGMTVVGYAQVNSWIAAGTNLSGTPGDITANRGGNTGYLWLGNASHHIGFDSSNYVMPNGNLYVNGDLVVTASAANNLSNKAIYDPQMMSQTILGGASYTLPTVTGNVGKWRYVKAWGQNLTMLLTNGTLILFGTQYSSGQYVLRNGDSLSIYCDGSNWWVL